MLGPSYSGSLLRPGSANSGKVFKLCILRHCFDASHGIDMEVSHYSTALMREPGGTPRSTLSATAGRIDTEPWGGASACVPPARIAGSGWEVVRCRGQAAVPGVPRQAQMAVFWRRQRRDTERRHWGPV